MPELLCFSNLCTGCGTCAAVCPHKAVTIKDGAAKTDRKLCAACGACASACPAKAREMSGRTMTVDEVMSVVLKDRLFYENSDGGVTFGGGEPTAQGQFCLELVQASVAEGLHVAVDTCGCCQPEVFGKILAAADLFLFDMKHMDPERHKELTGRDNRLILQNLEAALESGREVRIRMPLMPGLNDSEDNIAAMAAFLGRYHRTDVDIMPCHTFGHNKYLALDRPLPAVSQYTPEELDEVKKRFARYGLTPVLA